MLVNTETAALLYLLDDPDEEVYFNVRNKLISIGSEILPNLQKIWENSENSLLLTRIDEVTQLIRFQSLCFNLEHWCKTEGDNLLRGISLVCSYQYPYLDFEEMYFSILNIKHDLEFSIEGEKSPERITEKINRIIFGDYGFRIVNREGLSARHYYLNQLFTDKKGEVVMLAMLYSVLTTEADLPIYMINLPNNKCIFGFFNKYFDRSDPSLTMLTRQEIEKHLLFYIDISRRGELLKKPALLRRFFHTQTTPLNDHHLVPLSNFNILILLITVLIQYYEKYKTKKKAVQQLKTLKGLIENYTF